MVSRLTYSYTSNIQRIVFAVTSAVLQLLIGGRTRPLWGKLVRRSVASFLGTICSLRDSSRAQSDS